MKKSSSKTNLIQSIQRAIDILDCFDDNNPELSLAEITKKVNLHKSTVYGIVNTLYFNDYLTQDSETSKYSLGIRLLIKSTLASEKLNLKNIAAKYIEKLTHKYDLTTHLNVFESEKVYCLDKLSSDTSYYTLSSIVGRALPLNATASGKLMLAFINETDSMKIIDGLEFTNYTENTITDKNAFLENLDKIRETGYSIEYEEVEYGAVSVGTPIFFKKEIVGTISVTSSTIKFELIKEEVIKDLIVYAHEISKKLS